MQNRRSAAVLTLVLAAVAAGAAAQSPAPSKILAPGARVEKLAGDFIFTEGVTADKNGNVYFVDQDNNRIMKYDTAGALTTFMQPSGYSNGMSFDPQGPPDRRRRREERNVVDRRRDQETDRAVRKVRGQAAQRAQRRLGQPAFGTHLFHRPVLPAEVVEPRPE